ncbi:hypothetical protein [Mycoplasma sp. ATU-Cv-508]|uniref:hypothetical protein n=1 Tax=Mycoplasma sp. ATU-Cv-508 TaxID=2048001 RepID=UPI001F2550B0
MVYTTFFYAPLWWSDAGGNGLVEMQNWIDRVKPVAGQGNWEQLLQLLKRIRE